MATLLEISQFAAAAYGGPFPSGDWRMLDEKAPENSEGFYAQAYRNDKTKEVIITYRGTRPTSLSDLLNDAKLTLHLDEAAQVLAADYARTVQANNQDCKIINTGHSLGGNLAQAATASLQLLEDVNVSAVLFNAPGIGSYPHSSSTKDYQVVNITSQADLINLAGGDHLGVQKIIPAGPTLNSALLPLALGLAGPIGWLLGAGKFLSSVVGAGHSINTITSYLEKIDPVLGSQAWPPTGPILETVGSSPTLNVAKDGVDTSTMGTAHLAPSSANALSDQASSYWTREDDSNFELNLGNVALHLTGGSNAIHTSATYTLAGDDGKGNAITLERDATGSFTYGRNTLEKNVKVFENGDGSTTFHSASGNDSIDVTVLADHSFIAKIATSGNVKTLHYDASTGEYSEEYHGSHLYDTTPTGVPSPESSSVHIAKDGSIHAHYESVVAVNDVTIGSDGRYDARTTHIDHPGYDEWHLDANGSGTVEQEIYGHSYDTDKYTFDQNILRIYDHGNVTSVRVTYAGGESTTYDGTQNGSFLTPSMPLTSRVYKGIDHFSVLSYTEHDGLVTVSNEKVTFGVDKANFVITFDPITAKMTLSGTLNGPANFFDRLDFSGEVLTVGIDGSKVDIKDVGNHYVFDDGMLHAYDSGTTHISSDDFGLIKAISSDNYKYDANDGGSFREEILAPDNSLHHIWTDIDGQTQESWKAGDVQYSKRVTNGLTQLDQKNLVTGEETQTSWDGNGRTLSQYHGGPGQAATYVRYQYNIDGTYSATLSTDALDADGHMALVVTSISNYTAAGRLIEVLSPDNAHSTRFTYDDAGVLSGRVEKSLKSDGSTTEDYYGLSDFKYKEIWSDAQGNRGETTYASDGSRIELASDIYGDKTERHYDSFNKCTLDMRTDGDNHWWSTSYEYTASHNLASQHNNSWDGTSYSLSNYYDENDFLYQKVELNTTHSGTDKTVTDYTVDGNSSGRKDYHDGTYSMFSLSTEGEHWLSYSSSGNLVKEITSNSQGGENKYYDDLGNVYLKEKYDQTGSVSTTYSSDRTQYFEEYFGINGTYKNDYSANGQMLHSVGRDPRGNSWDITYNSSGQEVTNIHAGRDGSRDVVFTNDGGARNEIHVGSYGADSIAPSGRANFVAGSGGDDVIKLTSGVNVVAYNIGDGRDTIVATNATSNVLSLGGGISYDMISFIKSGADLILSVWGDTQAIVLQNWYETDSAPFISKLQLVLASPDSTSENPLQSNAYQQFDFVQLVDKFDQARQADPTMTAWSASAALPVVALAHSNDELIGGALAADYGQYRGLDMQLVGIAPLISDPYFGVTVQSALHL